MPRSGSELLQVLASQHPDIYGSITSSTVELWKGSFAQTASQSAKAQGIENNRKATEAFIREGTKAFYETKTDKRNVIDKSRGWFDKLPTLRSVFPNAKMLCMVREEESIIESLEQRYRTNPMHPDFAKIPLEPRARAEYWRSRPPLKNAKEGIAYLQTQPPDSGIFYIKYEILIQRPVDVMQSVFRFLGVDPFIIDAENVKKTAYELDGVFGPLGDHNVKRKIVSPNETPADLVSA